MAVRVMVATAIAKAAPKSERAPAAADKKKPKHRRSAVFDAEGNETTVPYEELLPVFVEGGYSGFMSSEWEGHMYSRGSGIEAVQKHHALCRKILAPYAA